MNPVRGVSIPGIPQLQDYPILPEYLQVLNGFSDPALASELCTKGICRETPHCLRPARIPSRQNSSLEYIKCGLRNHWTLTASCCGLPSAWVFHLPFSRSIYTGYAAYANKNPEPAGRQIKYPSIAVTGHRMVPVTPSTSDFASLEMHSDVRWSISGVHCYILRRQTASLSPDPGLYSPCDRHLRQRVSVDTAFHWSGHSCSQLGRPQRLKHWSPQCLPATRTPWQHLAAAFSLIASQVRSTS